MYSSHKCNALFSACLKKLLGIFDVHTFVRMPFALLVPEKTIDLSSHSGFVPVGEKLDDEPAPMLVTITNLLDL